MQSRPCGYSDSTGTTQSRSMSGPSVVELSRAMATLILRGKTVSASESLNAVNGRRQLACSFCGVSELPDGSVSYRDLTICASCLRLVIRASHYFSMVCSRCARGPEGEGQQ